MSSIGGKEDAISSGVIDLGDSCCFFSLAEIQSMTNHFDDELVIGVGGFGKVYKGFIDNGTTTVAIKRLNVESKQGAEEFWTEVKMLSKLQHTHLVALISFCQSSEFQEMILVYEYMARGTLADHLYNRRSGRESGIISSSTSHLTWEQRLNICIGAARGLDYLHNKSIIHRDVKTTNILLDEKWAAKISDFGLSKSTTSHSTTHVTTKVKGTFGYLDPNYFYTHRLTKKSDVYAFGVVLLEVLCGRPPVDTRLEEEEISLTLWAQHCIKKGKLDRIVDSSLSGQIIPQSLKYFVEVAYNCLNYHPKERPTMAEVVGILDLSLISQHKGKSKGIIEKVFQGIAIVPKVMNRWWHERKENVTKNVPSKDSFWKPLPDSVTQPYRRFTLAEIRAATNDFDNGHLIGVNRISEVYKGCLDGKIGIVAIVRFGESTLSQLCKEGSFNIEVHSLLGNHPNIVSLIGLCNEKPELIAVYDYMANGSLDTHLFFGINNDPLQWKERLKICIGAARGLQHLHLNTKHRFIHCDIKPSNILLDENWVAKLVQFGFSKLIPDNFTSETILVSRICGTYGYMAPEYLMHGILTKKSDVYSFGMVLLDVLCAKKSYAFGLNKGEESLSRWFISNIKKGTIDQVIDPYLIGKIAPRCLKEFVNIALSSVLDQGIRRPSMDYVVESLHCALQLQEAWENCIEIGVELPVIDLSCCNIFSIDGDLTIGGLSLLPSNIDDALTSDFDER